MWKHSPIIFALLEYIRARLNDWIHWQWIVSAVFHQGGLRAKSCPHIICSFCAKGYRSSCRWVQSQNLLSASSTKPRCKSTSKYRLCWTSHLQTLGQIHCDSPTFFPQLGRIIHLLLGLKVLFHNSLIEDVEIAKWFGPKRACGFRDHLVGLRHGLAVVRLGFLRTILKGQATFLLEFFLETILSQLSIFVVASTTLLAVIVTWGRRCHGRS